MDFKEKADERKTRKYLIYMLKKIYLIRHMLKILKFCKILNLFEIIISLNCMIICCLKYCVCLSFLYHLPYFQNIFTFVYYQMSLIFNKTLHYSNLSFISSFRDELNIVCFFVFSHIFNPSNFNILCYI